MDHLNQGPVEKMDDKELKDLVREIRDGQIEVLNRVDRYEREQDKRFTGIEQDLEKMCGAFPSGDVEGHRRYHETMIELVEEKRRLRRAIIEKTIGGLVWSGIAGLGIAVFHYLKTLLKQGSP